MKKIKYILGISFLFWCVSSIIVTYKLTHRNDKIYNENVPVNEFKEELKFINLATRDSLHINGVIHTKETTNPYVIILHGNGGDFAENYELMDSLSHHNINSLAISLRCHGSSEGEVNDIGFSSQYDVISSVNYIKSVSGSSKIIIAGRSLGSAAAIFAAEKINENVYGYFLESPYYNLKKAVKYRIDLYFNKYFSVVPYYSLLLFSSLYIDDIDEISPFEYSKKISTKKNVLFLSGDSDKKAPLEDVIEIAKNIKNSETVVFKGAKHQSLFKYDRKKYLRNLLKICN